MTVKLIAAGGTIAMAGEAGASPALDAAGLLASVPGLPAAHAIEPEDVSSLPGALLALADQLRIARAACDAARSAPGVVVTHGTDTLEETAMLCDAIYDGDAPIVFTGAIRPASDPGADGPANLLDAVSVARSDAARGLGVLVVFGGEIHHARCVRKEDTASPTAFASPQTGPLGRAAEGRVSVWARVARGTPTLDPPSLDARVVYVPAVAGDDGTLARAALAVDPDGVVLGTLGAGHLHPDLMALWAEAAERIPVVAHCRPRRGTMLDSTYGFPGSERDLRASAIIPASFLSPQAARMKLLACLGSGLDLAATRAAFAQDDR